MKKEKKGKELRNEAWRFYSIVGSYCCITELANFFFWGGGGATPSQKTHPIFGNLIFYNSSAKSYRKIHAWFYLLSNPCRPFCSPLLFSFPSPRLFSRRLGLVAWSSYFFIRIARFPLNRKRNERKTQAEYFLKILQLPVTTHFYTICFEE